ncbi:AprI/Inh family metalloprotease inhibitor [Pseudomonas sp. C2B4]|uniref:AprI/Inh family metalloprotease inhibitor n=1 Tax=Pseudomonas sp. C2B4 TaxID=2735270 RepID=UPI00158637C4|nr:AprI/Inh family metalloprotease inhibitor [Pseudomonas sp. C2B4]NUU38048.1 AprI/Inh family metalloprotease inhibitor [Pseudomonas sp. C2B4]
MTCSVFSHKASAWLLAALVMFIGDATMAGSLKLADPSALAGKWQVTLNATQDTGEKTSDPASTCLIDLRPDQTLGDDAHCLAAWLGEPVTGWFPEPDGISITGKEGSRILFFGRQREGLYQGTLHSGRTVTLKHPAHQA